MLSRRITLIALLFFTTCNRHQRRGCRNESRLAPSFLVSSGQSCAALLLLLPSSTQQKTYTINLLGRFCLYPNKAIVGEERRALDRCPVIIAIVGRCVLSAVCRCLLLLLLFWLSLFFPVSARCSCLCFCWSLQLNTRESERENACCPSSSRLSLAVAAAASSLSGCVLWLSRLVAAAAASCPCSVRRITRIKCCCSRHCSFSSGSFLIVLLPVLSRSELLYSVTRKVRTIPDRR